MGTYRPFFAQQDPLALLQELETSAGQNLKFYNLNPTTLQESYETELAKDFIRTILNPRDPVTAEQALLHPWFDADEEGLPPLPRAPPGSPVDWPDAETEGENEFVSFEDRDFELGASEETESGSLAGSETEDEKDGLELPGLALEISNISLGSPRKQRASLRSRADSVGTLFALCG